METDALEVRVINLEKELKELKHLIARYLHDVSILNTSPKPAKQRRHTYEEEMDNLRKAMELGRLARTAPRSVFRAAQKKFFADGGWTPPKAFIDIALGEGRDSKSEK